MAKTRSGCGLQGLQSNEKRGFQSITLRSINRYEMTNPPESISGGFDHEFLSKSAHLR
jgi:hypothetical protein